MALKYNWQKKYRSDLLIAITISVLPFLGYTHLLFSTELKAILLFGIEYSHIFFSNSTFVWYLFKSIIPFALLLIWFTTISFRWKYLIVPLIILYLNNIMDNLFDSFRKYPFYLNYYENHTLAIKVLIISSTIITIFFCDFYYFKSYRKRLLEISFESLMSRNIKKLNITYRQNLEYLIVNRNKIDSTSYLQKIYNAQLILENRLKKNFNTTVSQMNKSEIRINLLVSSTLLLTTLFWFIHYLIPEEQVWDLGIIQVHNNGFLNVRIFVWFLLQKLIILIPLVLWFITCQHWWKYAILSPIILYSFQFWEATQDVSSLDAAGNIKAFPAIFCVVLLLLMISKAIKYRVEILMMYEHLTEEIEDLLKNADFNANSVLYKNVKRFKLLKAEIAKETDARKQLMKLIILREELVKQLNINY